MNSPSIMLIGTDRYVIDSCLRRGLDVVVVRGFPAYDSGQVVIPEGVREILVEDQRNPEAILSALDRAGLAHHRFEAIQTSYELSLATAGLLAQHLGCRAPGADLAVRFRDKWIQKREVREAGVPVARSTFVSDIRRLSDAAELPYPRAVLKPASGAGTALTTVVASAEELRAAARRFQDAQPSARQFVLEEFIEGDEWVADGVVVDGRLAFVAIGTYGIPCLAMVQDQAALRMWRFDPDEDAWAYAAADSVIRDALTALGLRDGVFHMELFHQPDSGKVFFSECGARRGGGLIQEEVMCKFGVDLADAAVQCALGAGPDLNVKLRPGAVGTTYLNGSAGTLVRCPAPGAILERPGVEFVRLDMPVGTSVPKSIKDTNTRIGQALVTGGTPAELSSRFDDLHQWFGGEVLIAPADVTKRELIQWQQAAWPHAGFGDRLYAGH